MNLILPLLFPTSPLPHLSIGRRERVLEAKVDTLQERLGESNTKAAYLEGTVKQLNERTAENKDKYADAMKQAEKAEERAEERLGKLFYKAGADSSW